MKPDIAFAINWLAAYTANPSIIHYMAVKWILGCLKGTINIGLTYQDIPSSNIIYGYLDATFTNADDYKLTSGYVFLAGDAAITWGSQKQSMIALSSTEAEYVALSESLYEIMWLRHLYGELGYIQKEPTMLLGDNGGLIAMAWNPQFHKWSKHIAIRWHWVRDLVQDGLVNIQDCCDLDQTADILTKALQQQKHAKHMKELGLSMVWGGVLDISWLQATTGGWSCHMLWHKSQVINKGIFYASYKTII